MNKAENLHWGISTLGCPELNLPQVMALAEKFGVEYLEIRTLNGSKNAYETLYLPENLPVMRQIAAEKRCRVLDTSFRLTVNTPEDRDELLKYARCADDFNIPYLRIFGGGKAGETLLPEHIRHALETLDWFEKQHFDTALALETHDICSNSKYCQEIAGHYGKFLPVIWDIHHTWQVAGEPLRETFAGLQKQIVAVHFKDSLVLPDGEIRMAIPGSGNLPLTEFFQLLAEYQLDCPVTLEHEKFWRPYLPELTEALQAWQQILASPEI